MRQRERRKEEKKGIPDEGEGSNETKREKQRRKERNTG